MGLSIPLEKLPDPSSQERTLLPLNPPTRERHQPSQEVSRDHIDSDQEPLPSETSESSRDSSEKLPTTSRTTLDSNLLPSLLSKRLLRLTWLVFSRTPTFAPSTPRESPSCQRTCNWPEESEERDPEHSVSHIRLF